MNPAVQIDKPILQPGFILLPRHAVYSGRSFTLERVEAVPEQSNTQMVEQSGEPFLLLFLCCFSHTVQSLGHALPTLRRVHVRRNDVLLRLCPSLHSLRRRLPSLARLVHRCRVGGGALARGPPSAAQTARAVFPPAAFTKTHQPHAPGKE